MEAVRNNLLRTALAAWGGGLRLAQSRKFQIRPPIAAIHPGNSAEKCDNVPYALWARYAMGGRCRGLWPIKPDERG